MAIREELELSGAWLFRWRSYLPLVMMAFVLMPMADYQYPWKSEALDIALEVFCFSVCFLGLGIRAYTIGYTPAGTSGRNTHKQKANTLNTTGIYSVVRHPLYLGNFFMGLGVVLFLHSWMLLVVYTLAYWIYYERIMAAEEAFLREKMGDEFDQWASRTPAFIPNFRHWTPPALPFSFRNVLRREYNGLLAVTLCLFLLEVLGDVVIYRRLYIETGWLIIVGIAAAVWLVLRTLKRHTTVLNVAGR
jgi:protein-S-isoprenylcysteine O-methyltransferase Ste14